MQSNGSTVGILGLTGAIKGDSSTNFGFFTETGFDIRFYTNGSATEKAIIDTSGNLGIGTTSPSAPLVVNKTGWAYSGNAYLTGVFTDGSGNKGVAVGYDNTSQTGIIYPFTTSAASSLSFWTYPGSGSITERMRLDSSGNLGLGVTPSASSVKTFEIAAVGNTLSGFGNGDVAFMSNVYYDSGFKYAGSNLATIYRQQDGVHKWFNAATGTAGNTITFTQAMTLSAAGGLTVGGTTDPGAGKILAEGSSASHYVASSKAGITSTYLITDANGANVQVDGSWPIRFTTNSTERARFDASGDLQVGTASSYGKLTVDGGTGMSAAGVIARFFGTSGQSLLIRGNGNAENSNNSYGALSDVKLKENIVDAASQWDDIKGLRVRKFRFKANPTAPLQIGLVAQEAEIVSPGLVDESSDYEEVEVTDAEGNVTKERQPTGTVTKSVKYSVLYMKAIKALQEAMARIESLEAKVVALEAK